MYKRLCVFMLGLFYSFVVLGATGYSSAGVGGSGIAQGACLPQQSGYVGLVASGSPCSTYGVCGLAVTSVTTSGGGYGYGFPSFSNGSSYNTGIGGFNTCSYTPVTCAFNQVANNRNQCVSAPNQCVAGSLTTATEPVLDTNGNACFCSSGNCTPTGRPCDSGLSPVPVNLNGANDNAGCPALPAPGAVTCYSQILPVIGSVVSPMGPVLCDFPMYETGASAVESAASAISEYAPSPQSVASAVANAQSSITSDWNAAVSALIANGVNPAQAASDVAQAIANCEVAGNCAGLSGSSNSNGGGTTGNLISSFCSQNPSSFICTGATSGVSSSSGVGESDIWGTIMSGLGVPVSPSGVSYGSGSGYASMVGSLTGVAGAMSGIGADFGSWSSGFTQGWGFFWPTNGGASDVVNCEAMFTSFGISVGATVLHGATVPDICTNTYMLMVPDFVDWLCGFLCLFGCFLMFYSDKVVD